jgi:hypothetical protein
MKSLFAQLGEATDDAAIALFMERNGRLRGSTSVHEAACWSVSQASFLQEAIKLDADWAPVVDDLNMQLHQMPLPVCSR